MDVDYPTADDVGLRIKVVCRTSTVNACRYHLTNTTVLRLYFKINLSELLKKKIIAQR